MIHGAYKIIVRVHAFKGKRALHDGKVLFPLLFFRVYLFCALVCLCSARTRLSCVCRCTEQSAHVIDDNNVE